MRLSILHLILLSAFSLQAQPKLPDEPRVAIIGDSITEQKLYSRHIEAYLLACSGLKNVHVFQFGWSGERAAGFAARLVNDLSVFKPNVATTCYGMNDGSYTAYTPAIGAEYEKNMKAILDGLQKVGVDFVAVGSPGAVDPDYFKRPTVQGSLYNENLNELKKIAQKLATENQQTFANVHDTMISALAKSKAALGKGYGPFGGDGFHPSQAGQLLMAQAFLKGLGMDGEIGTITYSLNGTSTATSGHEVMAAESGKITIKSSRWPFCFEGDERDPNGTRSMLPFTPFQEELNRFALIVKGLSTEKAKVTWGKASREFSREALEKGINLAAEFVESPFDAAFKKLNEAISAKQNLETKMIKNLITHLRHFDAEAKADPEFFNSLSQVKAKFMELHQARDKAVHDQLTSVTHTIEVTPIP